MKKKDLIYLVLAVAILLVAGYVGYTQLFASKKSTAAAKTTQVEVVGSISPDMDSAVITKLNDTTNNQDYSVTIDTKSGVGNAAIFGQ